MTQPTIMPDTNLWNYIVEADGVEKIRRAARDAGVLIAVSPAAVYECLRVTDKSSLRRRAKALTRNEWHRLMPEAFSEADDLAKEISRLRPEWLIDSPDLRVWHKNRSDWMSGFWQRTRRDPIRQAAIIKQLGDPALKLARDETKLMRSRKYKNGQTAATLNLDTAVGRYGHSVPGWDGTEAAPWRFESAERWWQEIAIRPSATTSDWLLPRLNINLIKARRPDWTKFWLEQVESTDLPREWIRWAMREAQATRQWSKGTPGDNQMATYLLQSDYFATSDRIFVDLINVLNLSSPQPLATPELVPGGENSVQFTCELIYRIGNHEPSRIDRTSRSPMLDVDAV